MFSGIVIKIKSKELYIKNISALLDREAVFVLKFIWGRICFVSCLTSWDFVFAFRK